MFAKNSRIFVGIILLSLIPLCYSSFIIYILLTFSAGIISFYELNKLGVNLFKIIFYIWPLFAILFPLVNYKNFIEKDLVILVVIFAQISNIFQYFGRKISRFIFAKVINILRNELSNFRLEFKQQSNFGFKSPKELSEFLQNSVRNFYLFETDPKKTILGYTMGFWSTLIIFSWIYPVLNFKTSIIWFLTGCMGDLYCSFIKRSLKVKHFSNFLGRYGGVLDIMFTPLALLQYNYWFFLCSTKLFIF